MSGESGPAKRMPSPDEARYILEKAPPYLRVGLILLAQTGVRTHSEGFSLCWDLVGLDNQVSYLRPLSENSRLFGIGVSDHA